MRSLLLLLAASCSLGGCRGPRVLSGEAIAPRPAMADMDPAALLHAANATPRAVSSFSAACRLSLVTPEGKTVNLDGAIIASEPGSLRLQAWKFDRPVIDLTVTPEGCFLFVRGEDGVPEGFASIPAGGLPTLAPLLTELPEEGFQNKDRGSFSWPASAFGVEANASVLVRLGAAGAESLSVIGPQPCAVQTLGFSNHRLIDGVAWPIDWNLAGRINATVLLEDVELDPDLPASAFEPPANARAF